MSETKKLRAAKALLKATEQGFISWTTVDGQLAIKRSEAWGLKRVWMARGCGPSWACYGLYFDDVVVGDTRCATLGSELHNTLHSIWELAESSAKRAADRRFNDAVESLEKSLGSEGVAGEKR